MQFHKDFSRKSKKAFGNKNMGNYVYKVYITKCTNKDMKL